MSHKLLFALPLCLGLTCLGAQAGASADRAAELPEAVSAVAGALAWSKFCSAPVSLQRQLDEGLSTLKRKFLAVAAAQQLPDEKAYPAFRAWRRAGEEDMRMLAFKTERTDFCNQDKKVPALESLLSSGEIERIEREWGQDTDLAIALEL